MRRLAALPLVIALLVPAGASALVRDPERYQLGWVERGRTGGKVVMTFRVKQIHFEFAAWAAQVEFVNHSAKTLRLKPQFALLVAKTKGQDPDFEALLARRSQPALPRILFPGQRWKGVIGGPGRPRRYTYIRVNFGYFVTNLLGGPGFAWITDHSFQIGESA